MSQFGRGERGDVSGLNLACAPGSSGGRDLVRFLASPCPRPVLFMGRIPVASDFHTATEEQEEDRDGDALWQCSPNTQQAARSGTHQTGQGARGKQDTLWTTR